MQLSNFGSLSPFSIQGTSFTPPYSYNIYRIKTGGTTLYLVGNTTASTFVDNVPDANLVRPFDEATVPPASFFELWPIPQTAQTIRFTGQRSLNPLVLDTDQADLDDILLIKGVAAQELARRESSDASMVAQQFSQRLALLRLAGPSAPSVWVNGEMSETRTRATRRVLLG
jgi:hypothetical protein